MGHENEANCLDCKYTFTVQHGGGFFFHLLRCDMCGNTLAVGFDELGELHLRFLKGLNGPYCIASAKHDEYVREHIQVESISREDYYQRIEELTGKCDCGGKYTFDAPPRCPECKSTHIEEGPVTCYYD